MIITHQEAIDYLNQLGDPIDWDNSDNNATDEKGWTLEQIRSEVLKGDEYDGMNIWQNMLDELDREDIKDIGK